MKLEIHVFLSAWLGTSVRTMTTIPQFLQRQLCLLLPASGERGRVWWMDGLGRG